MSESLEKAKKSNLANFIIEHSSQDRLARFIGVSFVVLLAIGVIYIGTWQAAYASQFYKVKFKINFLEGVQPGMKIRYQGGVIIGEVLNIESDYQNHYLNAIIRNDFKIIKMGTKVSLKEQGSFGGSYIDITTIPYYFNSDMYNPDDVIQISEIIPFQTTLDNFLQLFQTDTGEDSIIVKRLIEINTMIKRVSENKDILPSQLNSSMKKSYRSISRIFFQIKDFNQKLFVSVDKLNNTLTSLADNLRINIPKIRRQTNKIYMYVRYNPEKITEQQFMHDEQLYFSMLLKIKHIKGVLENFKNYPYKLIFESGL